MIRVNYNTAENTSKAKQDQHYDRREVADAIKALGGETIAAVLNSEFGVDLPTSSTKVYCPGCDRPGQLAYTGEGRYLCDRHDSGCWSYDPIAMWHCQRGRTDADIAETLREVVEAFQLSVQPSSKSSQRSRASTRPARKASSPSAGTGRTKPPPLPPEDRCELLTSIAQIGELPPPADEIAASDWLLQLMKWGWGYGRTMTYSPAAIWCWLKDVPPESLIEYGVGGVGQASSLKIAIPCYSGDGFQTEQHHWVGDLWEKGKFLPGHGSGMFLPGGRLPKPGESWLICEGPKDACSLHDMGYTLTAGAPGKSLGRHAKMFSGCKVTIIFDHEREAYASAKKVAKQLYRAGATEVRIVRLLRHDPPASKGPDVRDVRKMDGGDKMIRDAIDEAEVVDAETGGEDDDEQLEACLRDLAIEVLHEDCDGSVTIYSHDTKKTTELKLGRIGRVDLVQACGQRGMNYIKPDPGPGQYSPEKAKLAIAHAAAYRRDSSIELRGVGIWPADRKHNETVVCNGSHLSIWDGSTLRRESRAVYLDSSYVIGARRDWYGHDDLAARCVRAIDPVWRRSRWSEIKACLNQWTFDRLATPIVGGMVLTTLLQSCLTWRPHIAITGKSQAGKSTLVELVSRMFGGLSLLTSDATKAGIVQTIKSDSVAIMIDEWDSHDHRQREAILRMMRGATGGGKSLRGSPSQQSRSENLHHAVWLSGVWSEIERDVDRNRILELRLVSPNSQMRQSFREPPDEAVDEWSADLIAIAIVIADQIAATRDAIIVSDVASTIDARMRKNLATVIATYSLADGEEDPLAAMETVATAYADDPDSEIIPDHEKYLGQILESLIDIGRGDKVTVAEALSQIDSVGNVKHDQELQRCGVRLKDGNLYVRRFEQLEISATTLRKSLADIDGAVQKPYRIGGRLARCVVIPADYLDEQFGIWERFE